MRRRPVLSVFLGLALLLPAALHVGLAILVHNRVADITDRTDAPVRFQHDGVDVGLFAGTIRIDNPRVRIPGQAAPILTAQRLHLERASSLAGWLWDGRFDLAARLPGMAQNAAWLSRQGASDEQRKVARMLGLTEGNGKARYRLAYVPAKERFRSEFHYTVSGDEPFSARLKVIADDVAPSAIAALGAMRTPDVGATRVETRYSNEAIRRAVATLAHRARLSEATLLRVLGLPVPYTWLAERLAREQVRVERIHIEPLLSGLRVDGVRRPAPNGSGDWQLEHLQLERLDLARVDTGLMVRELNVRSDGLTVPTGALRPDVAALLDDAGYKAPTLDVSARYRHDPSTGALALAPLTVDAEAMGRLQVAMRLAEVDPARVTRRPTEAFITGAFQDLALRYRDKGLTRRLQEALIARGGAEAPSALRQQVRTWIEARTGDQASTLTQATDTFLANPGRLVVRAEPASAVPIRILAGLAATRRYAAIAERLELTAEATPAPD
jgi:hypothetical protein